MSGIPARSKAFWVFTVTLLSTLRGSLGDFLTSDLMSHMGDRVGVAGRNSDPNYVGTMQVAFFHPFSMGQGVGARSLSLSRSQE